MALDRLFVSKKIGNNGEHHDDMIIDYYDEWETGVSFTKALSRNCSRVYRFIQVDRRMKPKIIELLEPTGFLKIIDPETGFPIPDPKKFRIRGGMLPTKELAAFSGESKLSLRDQANAHEPINGLLLNEEAFKPTQLFESDGSIIDRALITQGDFSLGTAGDYLTSVLWYADMDITNGLSANLTGTQISAIIETATGGNGPPLNGYTLKHTSDAEHYGQQGRGHLTSINHATWFARWNFKAPSGTFILEKLNFKRIAQANASQVDLYLYISPGAAHTVNVRDVFYDGNTLLGDNCGGFFVQHSGWLVNMFNCVFGRAKRSNDATQWGGVCTYIVNPSSVFENITCYDGYIGFRGRGAGAAYATTKKNIACFDNSNNDFNSVNAGVFSKCASSDVTGSEAVLRNLALLNEFETGDISLANYLKVKAGGQCQNGGVAPNIGANTYGIRGNARPRGALYSIGADEYAAAAIARGVPAGIFEGSH